MASIRWVKNEGGEIPGLLHKRSVCEGEWLGYVNGSLRAVIHKDSINGMWFGYIEARPLELQTIGYHSRIVHAKRSARAKLA